MSMQRSINWFQIMTIHEATAIGESHAIETIGRRVGLSYWPAYRLIKGKAKTLDADVADKIRQVYLEFCARQITKLQNEFALAGDVDDLDNLKAEIAAISQKIQAHKERLK